MPGRRKKWWTEVLKTTNDSRDLVILKNPAVAKRLNNMLVKEYWPVIQKALASSGYIYDPVKPKTKFKFEPKLTRSMEFMLDDGNSVFFLGTLSCSTAGWSLKREFFLSLGRDSPAELVFEILGNSRFCRMPPTLMINKPSPDFYQITLNAFSVAGWEQSNSDEVKDWITKIIEASVMMHEMVRDGRLTVDKVGEFLTLAYTAYESC